MGEGDTGGGGGGTGGEGGTGGGRGHSLVRPHIHTQAEKSSQTRGCISYITRPQTMYSPSAVIWILPRLNGGQYVLLYSCSEWRLWQII
jgi:hypothetical protein